MCAIDHQVTVLDPVGELEAILLGANAGQRLVGPLRGRRIGIVDNQITGMRSFASSLAAVLRNRHEVQEVRFWTVPRFPESGAQVADLVEEIVQCVDAVVVGLGNCGACTTWDCEFSALLLVRLPVINIVTEPFEQIACTALRTRGYPEAPVAVIPNAPWLLEESPDQDAVDRVAEACESGLAGSDS